MRVLVTGCAGFVGPHLVRALAAAGHSAWGTGLETAPPEALAALPGFVGWTQWDVTADGTPVANLLATLRPDAIVHLAGQASAARSFDDPIGTADVNFGGTLKLLEAAREARFEHRIVVVGSSEAYGVLPEEKPVTEDAPLHPVSPYGVSKAAADLATRAWAEAFGLKASVTRSFSHAGPGQSPLFALPSWASQIAAFETKALAGEKGPFKLRVGNMKPVRDYTDVRDVARAYVLLAERAEPGTAYNVSSGVGRSLRQIVQSLTARARVPVEIVEDPARLRPTDLSYLVGDSGRLERATGWVPSIALEDTLAAVMDDARSRARSLVEGAG